MERKIGDTFEFEGKKLQVKESTSSGCDGCFFDELRIPCSKNVAGYCGFKFRTDKKEIIFVEVKNEQPQEQAEQPQKEQPKLNLYEPKKERFDPKTLKAFDKVLIKNACGLWYCNIFSHYVEKDLAPYHCILGNTNFCIPYNDDTKHLVGTTYKAPDFYKYWED